MIGGVVLKSLQITALAALLAASARADAPPEPLPVSANVRTVYTARDGALWVGLERGGVARVTNGRCAVIAPMAPKIAGTRWVSSFAEDREGGMWFGFAPDLRVQRWSGGKLQTYTL